MPGPSSPARKKKRQVAASKKPKSSASPPSPPYEPAPNAPVRQLQTYVKYAWKVWWNPWLGDPFINKKKNRGDKRGAKGWVRRKFCGAWWEENMSGIEATEEDKLWYFDATKVGGQIYTYLNNGSVRGSKGRDPNGPSSDKVTVKVKAFGHDCWRRENPDLYENAVEEWKVREAREPNFGELRKISSEAFKSLPQDEQDKWNRVAQENLQASQALVKLAEPSDRVRYYDGFKKTLDAITDEAEKKANILTCALILHEKPDGGYKIDRKFSEGVRAFGKTPAIAAVMRALQEWVEETAGESVEGVIPAPTVYPDYSRDNFPSLPNYVGWTLEPMQGLVRDYMKKVFEYQGGVGRLPWTEISGNLDKFFDIDRLPRGRETVFGDPSTFLKPTTVIWLDFMLACHTGQTPDEKQFQFALVPAGTNPIHPSESQEESREQVERDGKVQWYLLFKRTVTKCHQLGGMKYTQGAHDFAQFLATGLAHVNAVCAPPQSWVGLPGANSSIPETIICDAEKKYYFDLAALLPEPQKDRIFALVNLTNEHQSFIPAADPKGVYKSANPLPKAIPSSSRPSAAPSTMWLPKSYYQAATQSQPYGSVQHVEDWRQYTIDSKILYHEPSGTLYGGDTGIVCITRLYIHLLLNFSAVRKDFNPPEQPPADYDITRLPLHDWDRLLGWIDAWLEDINDSIKILRLTADERRRGLGSLTPPPGDSLTLPPGDSLTPPPGDSLDQVEGGSNALQPPIRAPPGEPSRKKGRRKPGRKGKRHATSDTEESAASSEPESNEEPDFEGLDKTSQDDEDSDGGLDPNEPLGGLLPENGLFDTDDDSSFDRLGLRHRYGFTGVDMSFDEGGIDAVYDRPSDSWVHWDAVFGKFPDLPAYEPVYFHTPNALLKQIHTIATSCKEAMDNLFTYVAFNPRVPSDVVKRAHAQAEDFPKFQVLYEYVFLRRAIWKDATRVATNGIFGHATHIALIFREAVQAQLMAQKVIEQGLFPDPDVGPTDVAHAIQLANKAAAELRWTFTELVAFQKLATEWYNELQGNWLYDEITGNLPALVQVVQGQLDWADETMELMAQMRSERKVFWDKNFGGSYLLKHQVSGMLYRFGCPSVKEEPAGLRDELERAKASSGDVTLTLSVAASEMAVDDQTVPGFTSSNATPAPGPQPMHVDPTPAAEAPLDAPAAPVAPVALVAPVAPAAPGPAPGPPTPAPSNPPPPPAVSVPPASATPVVAPKKLPVKRKPEPELPTAPAEPESAPPAPKSRRTSSRVAASATHVEPPVPKTRAAARAKAAEKTQAGTKSRNANGNSSESKRARAKK